MPWSGPGAGLLERRGVMGQLMGVGLSHYPPLSGRDEDMAGILHWTLEDPSIPPTTRDPSSWPARMRDEWGDDGGVKSAAAHRAKLLDAFDHLREEIDAFQPDAVLIWGDDQYENFREDVVPPFCVQLYDDLEVFPWRQVGESGMMKGKANVWGEDSDMSVHVRGARDMGRCIVDGLLQREIDVSYAYRPLHHAGLPHAFLNTILYLDHRRAGFDYPVLPFSVNCYGRRVVSCKGYLTRMADPIEFDPPSPSPARLMRVGAAAAEALAENRCRVVLIASSSWSHAFLCDKTWRLRPDTPSDRRLYAARTEGDFETWRKTPLEDLENSGQQEMLNWFAHLGAMERTASVLEWSTLIETDVFNSNKAFPIFR